VRRDNVHAPRTHDDVTRCVTLVQEDASSILCAVLCIATSKGARGSDYGRTPTQMKLTVVERTPKEHRKNTHTTSRDYGRTETRLDASHYPCVFCPVSSSWNKPSSSPPNANCAYQPPTNPSCLPSTNLLNSDNLTLNSAYIKSPPPLLCVLYPNLSFNLNHAYINSSSSSCTISAACTAGAS